MAKGGKHQKEESIEVNFSTVMKVIKSNWNWIILLLIILFALNIRVYHAGYPVIGYHAWKETHYLTEARNFAQDGFFKHGFFVPEVDYTGPDKDQSGAHSDTFPMTSVIVGFFFMIFGPKLLVARLILILFNLGTIVMLYLFIRKLFNREDLPLLVAFLAAINPLFVFFGRNVMLQGPGVFFAVVSAYFLLKFRESDRGKHLIYTVLFLALATLTEYPYAFIAIPLLIIFPWKRLKNLKKYVVPIGVSAVFVVLVVLWFYYSNYYVANLTGTKTVSSGSVDWTLVFTKYFWLTTQKSYIADNFTTIGFIFAVIGVALLIIFLKRKSLGNRFMLGYLAATIIFLIVMANKLKGHNYHWFPVAPFFIIMLGYFIFWVAYNGGKLLSTAAKKEKAKSAIFHITRIAIIIVFIAILWQPSFAAMNRMWDTQFYGLDVAGQYIKDNSQPGERLIHSDEQSYAVVWSADRMGYAPPKNVADLKILEDQQNVKWILMYQWGVPKFRQNPELWDYIINSYSLKQIAFFQQSQQVQPVYFLFQKGGAYNESQLNEMVQGKPIMSKSYDTKTQGTVVMNYINI